MKPNYAIGFAFAGRVSSSAIANLMIKKYFADTLATNKQTI